ncbi:hypothetical protein JR316_0012690 [Psilocybe cubensis]|uniref:Uncharacterized protein n=2 Tax=Psilocybe cubensis TaxID=181762 RepID=A0A8H7XQS8_PSICU|nr:hypothetical protein JR316_0012690 [Psilocybe cubensis]KAH9475573.1 hypothetical protein JR316_0012690 [Psilocybe cubensis]
MSVIPNSPYALRRAEYRYTTPPRTQRSELICPPAPRKPRKRPVLTPDMVRDIPEFHFTPVKRFQTPPPPTGTNFICPPAPRKKVRDERFSTALHGHESPIAALQATSYYWLRSRKVPNTRGIGTALPARRSNRSERMYMETMRTRKFRQPSRTNKPSPVC